ncbi:MAG TPA: FAD-binding oxidoreductase [Fimbriimonadaceae bacterium]|nr:FAD-binding oxidoreductase [Fimbriimonadaceae bacterium]
MSTQLTGRVIHQTDPGYVDAHLGFAIRFDYDANKPTAIVFCQNTQDVVNAVKWARENKVRVRLRSGRHSYEAYSSLIKDGLIIDLSEMNGVSVDSAGSTATVQPGLDMLQLTEKLADSGVGLPLATGPTVGLGGLVQGGGFGMTSRLYGLVCDCAIDFEMVDAHGRILHANKDTNPDLFWALRGGGGGNFGVVTAITFNVFKMGNVGIFNIQWRWDDFVAVVDAWQHWAPGADHRMTSLISLHVDRTITVQGQYTAEDQDLPLLNQFLQPMFSIPNVAPINVQIMFVPFLQGSRIVFGVDPMNPSWAIRAHDDAQLFKSMSAIATEPFPQKAIEMLKTALENVPPLSAPPSQPSMVQLLGGGGKVSEIAKDATAVWHRDAKFVVQYDGYWTAPQDKKPTMDWAINLRNSLLPYANGAYVNYHDATLGPNYMNEYFRGNAERLTKVKRQYDPGNFFRFAQSIPVAKP